MLRTMVNRVLFLSAFALCGVKVYSQCGTFDGYDNQLDVDSSLTAYYSTIDGNGTSEFMGKLVYNGDGWIGWGFHTTKKMVGATAVVALPWVPSVALYDLNGETTSSVVVASDQSPLITATVDQSNGVTTMTFTHTLDSQLAVGASLYHLFAYKAGTSFTEHTRETAVKLTLEVCDPNSTGGGTGAVTTTGSGGGLTDVEKHGIVMMVAWLGVAPLGAFTALFARKLSSWLKIHMFFQFSALCLTIAGFVMGLNMVEDHFQNTHGRLGVAVLVGIIVQNVLAGLRPHAPEQGQKPTKIRWLWSSSHKLLAGALIVMAIYEMNEGIEWGEDKGDVSDNLYNIMWGIAGVTWIIGVFLLIVRGCKRMNNKKPVAEGYQKRMSQSELIGHGEGGEQRESEMVFREQQRENERNGF